MSDRPADEKQLDESYAALTQSTRRRQRTGIVEISFVAGAAVLIAVSTAFSAWNAFELRRINEDAAEIRRIILLGTECVVEQLADHDHLTGLAHRAAAKDHGYSYPIPPGSEPPVIPGVLEQVCETFLHTTTTSRP